MTLPYIALCLPFVSVVLSLSVENRVEKRPGEQNQFLVLLVYFSATFHPKMAVPFPSFCFFFHCSFSCLNSTFSSSWECISCSLVWITPSLVVLESLFFLLLHLNEEKYTYNSPRESWEMCFLRRKCLLLWLHCLITSADVTLYSLMQSLAKTTLYTLKERKQHFSPK